MALGLPVIATDVGGNPEAVVHSETGLIVPPKNPMALGMAIVSLFQNASKRKALGQAGKRRFQKYFTLPQCIQHYEETYRLLNRKKTL